MESVKKMILKVARSNSTVLVRGESGTGKELIARAVHNQSPRSTEMFQAVNCAAINENLLESELFGHEKGSFTGAHAEKKGLFEIADRGTLFLDEIAELDVGIQAKLLRALQERKIRRVGGTHEISVDVRVIAATNRDLRAMVADGRFRDDLYYRINVLVDRCAAAARATRGHSGSDRLLPQEAHEEHVAACDWSNSGNEEVDERLQLARECQAVGVGD
jgi:transcriptional regulator with PAS, ATPase and Fis domain